MGACLSLKCGCHSTEPVSPTPDGSVESVLHPERSASGPNILSNYRQHHASCEEIETFYSFDKEESRFISVNSIEELNNSRLKLDGLHEPRNRPRRILKCGRTGEFYGYRDRIPSHADNSARDMNYWWSAANLSRPVILNDLGAAPVVLSRPIKVTVVPSSFFASHRDIEVFPEYLSLCETLRNGPSQEEKDSSSTVAASSVTRGLSRESTVVRLIIFKLKMGEQVMVSLNEVIQEQLFDEMFHDENRNELLERKMKLILSPVNLPLPIPAKKPRDAETVGSYFGMDNVDLYFDISMGGEVKVASVLVNIYSKWIIRKFLPLVTSNHGRICDFILLSSDDRTIFADFRLLSTEVSLALIKGNALS